ncbi:MAG: hypothetical protein NVSMB25_22820 [Thermoleophilaceae bacterium]
MQKFGDPASAAPDCPARVELRPAPARLLRERRVILTAACDQPCTATFDATVLRARHPLARARRVTLKLLPGTRARVSLRFDGRSLRRARRALGGRRGLAVRLQASATSFAGSAPAVVRRTRVRRR